MVLDFQNRNSAPVRDVSIIFSVYYWADVFATCVNTNLSRVLYITPKMGGTP